jgi:hypothetical protein
MYIRKRIKLIIISTRNAPEDARRFYDRCSGVVGQSEHNRSPPRFRKLSSLGGNDAERKIPATLSWWYKCEYSARIMDDSKYMYISGTL